MNKKYNVMDKVPPLKKFTFLGTADYFNKKLSYLAAIAEPENWRYNNPKNEYPHSLGVLYQYIMHTFSKAMDDNKILSNEEYAIFNTGLLTINGEEIFMLFERNKENNPEWFFKSFHRESAHEIPQFFRDKLPCHIDYFENCKDDAYFDSALTIHGSLDHIINDNYDRLPEKLRKLPRNMVIDFLNGSKDVMKKRILRNNRLVIPQYYNKKIMYLAPLKVGDDVIALAIEKHENSYRINTILTAGMAYCNARLLMKPESNWLKPE